MNVLIYIQLETQLETFFDAILSGDEKWLEYQKTYIDGFIGGLQASILPTDFSRYLENLQCEIHEMYLQNF